MSSTLRDISKLVNASEATVSLVLNGHYRRVSKETRQRIEAAAHELGYRPNRLAQNLARGSTMNIVILLNDLRNPFYAGLASQISRALEPHGYHIIPTETQADIKREAELLNLASQRISDGVICLEALPNQHPDVYADVARRMPFVLRHQAYPRYSMELLSGLTRVGVDYGHGCEILFDHLKSCGVRRLGMLLNAAHDPTVDAGNTAPVACFFRDLLSRNAGWLTQTAIRCVSDEQPMENWYVQTKLLLQSNPELDGLYVHHLRAIPAVYAAIDEIGMRPGRDIAIASVDDHESAAWMRPGTTVIAESLHETTNSLVSMLLERLAGKEQAEMVNHETSVTIRESTTSFVPRCV